MRLFGRGRGVSVPEVAEPGPVLGEFVVVEEAIDVFVLYPADAVPERQSGREFQGATPPRGWPVKGKLVTIMHRRF